MQSSPLSSLLWRSKFRAAWRDNQSFHTPSACSNPCSTPYLLTHAIEFHHRVEHYREPSVPLASLISLNSQLDLTMAELLLVLQPLESDEIPWPRLATVYGIGPM